MEQCSGTGCPNKYENQEAMYTGCPNKYEN